MIDGISVLIGLLAGSVITYTSLRLGMRISWKMQGGEGDVLSKEPIGINIDQEEILYE